MPENLECPQTLFASESIVSHVLTASTRVGRNLSLRVAKNSISSVYIITTSARNSWKKIFRFTYPHSHRARRPQLAQLDCYYPPFSLACCQLKCLFFFFYLFHNDNYGGVNNTSTIVARPTTAVERLTLPGFSIQMSERLGCPAVALSIVTWVSIVWYNTFPNSTWNV